MIAQGEGGLRIDTSEKTKELLLIAETTNYVGSPGKNIHDIYQLELGQRCQYMSPAGSNQSSLYVQYSGFLRMYAVIQSQDELADIIYEFSSLLRNNISDEAGNDP